LTPLLYCRLWTWVFGYNLGGESWDGEEEGEEEGEIEEESVGRVGIYWRLPMESLMNIFHRYTRQWVHRWLCHITIRRSWLESLGHSVGKIIWKKFTSSHRWTFQKTYIICRQYGRYIPTEVEMKLFLSVMFTDEIISIGIFLGKFDI
jgi:hypothetical protein